MDTNVNMASPARKRFSIKSNLIEFENPTEDECENELKNRRLEAINKATELRRRSAATPLTTGLNAAQLAQHCNDCIKLSTENKINSKNAFSLLLIDFMGAMAKKTDAENVKSFQAATSTLDASVKIYGYRVDAVHAEAVKLANGFYSKELQEALEGDDEKLDDKADDKKKLRSKLKKKKKKVTVVSSNCLNTKSECEALLDVVPKPTLLPQYVEGGFNLLNRIPKYNDGCLLMVEADVPCCQRPSLTFKDDCDPENILSILKHLPVSMGDRICDEGTGLVLRQEVSFADEADAVEVGVGEMSQTSAFEFDINASVDEIEYDDQLAAQQRLAIPAGGFDSGDEIAVPPPPVRSACASITHMKPRLALHNMEYSMFDDKVMKAWAGPTYWKIRPSIVHNSENNENEEACQGVSKRTRRGKPKELAQLFHVPDDVLEKHLAPASKAVLGKSTLCSWKSCAVTLSEDYKYKPRDLFMLFYIPVTVTSLEKSVMVIDDDLEVENNAQELDYCSSQLPHDDDDDDDNEGAADVEVEEVYNDDNMVAAPIKVGMTKVCGLKRYKPIDIKLLKNCIWQVLNDFQPTEPMISFQKLYDVCCTRLPSNVVSSMTCITLFNALLHLTNEKSLVLLQPDKTADFTISLN